MTAHLRLVNICRDYGAAGDGDGGDDDDDEDDIPLGEGEQPSLAFQGSLRSRLADTRPCCLLLAILPSRNRVNRMSPRAQGMT